MKAYLLEITLKSPALPGAVRWGPLYTPGSERLGGSTIAGAIRRRYGITVKCGDAFPVGSIPAPKGSLKVKGVGEFLPSPKALEDLAQGRTSLSDLRRDLATELLSTFSEGPQRVVAELMLAGVGGLSKAITGDSLAPLERIGDKKFVKAKKRSVEVSERTSVSILMATRTSKPKALFHYTVFEEGQRFWTIAFAEDLPENMSVRIGNSRSRGLGKAEVRAREVKIKEGGFLLSTVPLSMVKDVSGLLLNTDMILWRNGVRYKVSALAPGSFLTSGINCPWCVSVDYRSLLDLALSLVSEEGEGS